MTWTKEPAWTGAVHVGCGNCGGTPTVAPLDMVIAVGFGAAIVSRDGREVFDGERYPDEEHQLAEFEAQAALDPDHDWRVTLEAPLRSAVYQRHEAGQWVLIASGTGFA